MYTFYVFVQTMRYVSSPSPQWGPADSTAAQISPTYRPDVQMDEMSSDMAVRSASPPTGPPQAYEEQVPLKLSEPDV